MAIGALSALRESGVRIPDEMAVTGFDDIPLARYMDPQLSSVRVRICDLGARAVEMLLDGIEHKNGHSRRRERVSTELVIRQSCGAQSVERPPPSLTANATKASSTQSIRTNAATSINHTENRYEKH
jgi:LacI family transcriptional regulator